jgi:hypothetical protein
VDGITRWHRVSNREARTTQAPPGSRARLAPAAGHGVRCSERSKITLPSHPFIGTHPRLNTIMYVKGYGYCMAPKLAGTEGGSALCRLNNPTLLQLRHPN